MIKFKKNITVGSVMKNLNFKNMILFVRGKLLSNSNLEKPLIKWEGQEEDFKNIWM